MADELRLKWGTLKGWHIETPEFKEAIERYYSEPNALGAMSQKDTETQKQALLDMCDLMESNGGTIYLDWDGKYVNAAEAKDYINNYGR